MSIPKKISLLLNNSVDSEILENCTKKKIFIKELVTFTKEILNGMESFMGSLIETNQDHDQRLDHTSIVSTRSIFYCIKKTTFRSWLTYFLFQ